MLTGSFQEEMSKSRDAKRKQMPASQQAATIRSRIANTFVNVTDGLEPHVVEIMNAKLEQMKEYFVD